MSELTPNTSKTSRANIIGFLPAIAFVIVLVAGFGVTIASLRDVPETAWTGITEPQQLFGGESTRRFSAQLNEHFLLSKPFSQIERAVTWTIAGDTGTAVSTGCKDWFFLSDELETFPDPDHSAIARANIVKALAKNLAGRGIQLVIAVVPDKSRIEQAHLCGLHRPASFAGRIDNWVALLKQSKINTINLEPVLTATPGERYYRTDSHWNENGANAAAAAIASYLQAEKMQVMPAVAPDKAALHSTTIARDGDLLRVSNLQGLPAILRPKPEQTQLTTIVASATPDSGASSNSSSDSNSNTSDDLFGDTGLPTVALIGTSFSRNANFVPFLGHYLGAPVASFAKEGGNFERSALAYLGGKTFQQSPPKVVLWEVPERMLQKPLSAAEKQWLDYQKQMK